MRIMTKKPQPYYSDSFKLGVVTRIVAGQITKEQARLDYRIGGKSTILEWMRKFGYCSSSPISTSMNRSDDPSDRTALAKKVRELEKQLQTERQRSEFYRTMIDVAERELGIPIKKKSDTNPSD